MPNMEAIDAKLGQKNDARYLAYTVLYVLMQMDATSSSFPESEVN